MEYCQRVVLLTNSRFSFLFFSVSVVTTNPEQNLHDQILNFRHDCAPSFHLLRRRLHHSVRRSYAAVASPPPHFCQWYHLNPSFSWILFLFTKLLEFGEKWNWLFAFSVEPTDKSVEVMRKFSEQYARRSGTYFCVDKGVTSVVIKVFQFDYPIPFFFFFLLLQSLLLRSNIIYL